MANVKGESKKLKSSIESIKLLLQSLSDSKKLDLQEINSPYLNESNLKKRLLGEGDGKSVNSDFLSDLMDTLMQSTGGGPDEAKTFIKKIIKKISTDSPKITRIIIEELFRAINCETDFSLNGIQITFKPEEIDFFDVLKTDPSSLYGSVMYEKQSLNTTQYPYPTNKFIYQRTVDTTPGVKYSSLDGLDLFTLDFDQFTQEYTLTYEDITVTDFVAYYYSSFELFNTKDLMSDILDMLFGVLSADISTKRVNSFAELNALMKGIASMCGNFYEQDSLLKESLIDRLSTEDENHSFDFDDEDTRYIEEEFNYRINKIYKLVDCGNFEAEMNTDLILDMLLDLDSNLNENDILESFLNSMGEGMGEDSGFDIPTINLNFNKDIFKQIPKAIIGKVLGPKSILPFITLTKAIDSAKGESKNVVEFTRNNNRFVTRVSTRIYDMYREEIKKEIEKRLTQLITRIVKEISKQQLTGRYAIILSLINAIEKLSKQDLSTCAGIIRALLSLLNLKTGIPLGVPFPLLYGSYLREGANSTRAFNNTIEGLQKMGYNVDSLPDGSPNKHVLGMNAQMNGLMKEFAENGAIQFVSEPATGVGALGPVSVPFVTGKGVILTSYSK